MTVVTNAQTNETISDDGFTVVDNPTAFNSHSTNDSTKNKKMIPKGVTVWKIDSRFGEREIVDRDTVHHLFMNSIFTNGMYGQYNTTGNVGAPRINRIFIDRDQQNEFMFANPYGYFLTPINQLRFTNTLSPITNIAYNSCGDKTDGEDHLNVKFAVNAGKRLGMGMKFDYIYGRGYYANQSTALFDWTFWTSYLGDNYQAHFAFSTDHMKLTENGGIQNDDYIRHPENIPGNFTSTEIPTMLKSNWNRIDGIHAFLTHRYNLGFSHKVPMTQQEIEARKFAIAAAKEAEEKKNAARKNSDGQQESVATGGRPADAKIMGDLKVDSLGMVQVDRIKVVDDVIVDSLNAEVSVQKEDTTWLKDEFVPVTSFIHTVNLDSHTRKYTVQDEPDNFYSTTHFIPGRENPKNYDDLVEHFYIGNTFALSLLEGFNKWAKAGFKAFIRHDYRHYTLPEMDVVSKSYNENSFYVGGQLLKSQGRTLHYNVMGDIGVIGENAGDLKIDADGDVNFKLFGDTTRIFLKAFFHRERPSFLMRHYHGQHFWWDNDGLESQIHTHLEGKLHIAKTKTTLRIAYDNIEKYAYLAVNYQRNPETGMIQNYSANVRQTGRNISLLTAEIYQDFRLGILNWENRVTFQQCSEPDILPVPTLNVWTNLYLNFRIAKVLRVHFGAEAYYFTKYDAPEWCGQLASYAVQENENVRTKVGNYPFINVYANFLLKGCRFFVMMSHINAGSGTMNYFTTPHHPMNYRSFNIGLSWNLFN